MGARPSRVRVGSDPLTGIDWVIVGAVVLLALFGWAQGFISGVLALVGFAVGALARARGSRPLVLSGGRESTWAPAFALVGAIIAGGVLAAGFEGVGARLRARLRSPAVRDARRRARCGADRVRRAADRLGARRGRAARRARHPARRPALGDPAPAQRGPAADRPAAEHAARRSTRSRASTGRSANVPRAAAGRSRATRRSPPPRAASSRCSARRAASASRARAGSSATGSWSPTPTSWPARTTRGCCRGPRAGAGRPGDRVRLRQRHRDAARRRARRARAGARARPQVRHLGGDPRLPAQRPVRRAARAGSARRARCSPRTPTAAARCAAGSRRCAGSCARATPAARWSTATAASWRRSSPPPRRARAAATRCRTRSCARRSRARAAGGHRPVRRMSVNCGWVGRRRSADRHCAWHMTTRHLRRGSAALPAARPPGPPSRA